MNILKNTGKEISTGILFEDVYREYRRPLESFLWSFCPDETLRAELIQDVFIRIFLALPAWNTHLPLKPYIYRITHNEAIDWLRRNSEKALLLAGGEKTDTQISRAPGPEELLFRNIEEEIVHRLINKMKPDEKRLVHLFYFEKLKLREIAGILKTPEGTLKYRLHKIRKNLALELRKEGIGENNENYG